MSTTKMLFKNGDEEIPLAEMHEDEEEGTKYISVFGKDLPGGTILSDRDADSLADMFKVIRDSVDVMVDVADRRKELALFWQKISLVLLLLLLASIFGNILFWL